MALFAPPKNVVPQRQTNPALSPYSTYQPGVNAGDFNPRFDVSKALPNAPAEQIAKDRIAYNVRSFRDNAGNEMPLFDVSNRTRSGFTIPKETYKYQMFARPEELGGAKYSVNEAAFNPQFAGTRQNMAAQAPFLDILQARALGVMPSAAEMQLRQGQEANLRQALALANSQRGQNAGLVNRNVQNALMQGNLQSNQQAMQARIQEQAQAANQYADLTKFYSQLGYTAEAAQAQAAMDLEKLKNQQNIDMLGIAEGRQQGGGGSGILNSIIGGGLSALGSIGAAAISDERAKTHIKRDPKEVSKFLDALSSNKYVYKNKAHGVGTYFSPMAQDLEKTSVGKSMVEERPDGLKQVNYGRGFGAILAAQAELNQRLKKLEARKGRVA